MMCEGSNGVRDLTWHHFVSVSNQTSEFMMTEILLMQTEFAFPACGGRSPHSRVRSDHSSIYEVWCEHCPVVCVCVGVEWDDLAVSVSIIYRKTTSASTRRRVFGLCAPIWFRVFLCPFLYRKAQLNLKFLKKSGQYQLYLKSDCEYFKWKLPEGVLQWLYCFCEMLSSPIW